VRVRLRCFVYSEQPRDHPIARNAGLESTGIVDLAGGHVNLADLSISLIGNGIPSHVGIVEENTAPSPPEPPESRSLFTPRRGRRALAP